MEQAEGLGRMAGLADVTGAQGTPGSGTGRRHVDRAAGRKGKVWSLLGKSLIQKGRSSAHAHS